ncbi:class V lanthionine synthetase subunit LxmK [Actinocrispum sp. NPDC049592]|uniref:class V lanthionine synthetase subunit LxmK n=1 Tax=Actinocrispum sp. NPDC049592 TaxID=3154835 RepID=UPI00341A6276
MPNQQVMRDSGIRPDLDRMPQLNAMLTSLGLGTLAPDSVTTFAGRNHNWAGTTDAGIRVFVKQIGGDANDASIRLRRAITVKTSHLAVPRCLGWDDKTRLMVFELLTPASNGARLAADGEFGNGLARQAGRLIAALHGARLPVERADAYPPVEPLESLSWQAFAHATGAELELWRILQSDGSMIPAVRRLHAEQQAATPTPVHCDLRLDQFLACEGRLYLTDFEELRLADPARDIGAFAGEWLHHSVIQIGGATAELSHEDIVDLATAEFERVRPLISAFWRAYVTGLDRPDGTLVRRATVFAGWHQFTRAFAKAHKRSRLSALDRATVGIGRLAMLDPDGFADAIGLGATS